MKAEPRNNREQRGCLACGGDLQELMTLPDMPAGAQIMPKAEELSQDHGVTLRLCQCQECGLVQFDTEPVSYYRDVIRAGGGTRTMTRLRHEEYTRLLHWMEQKRLPGRRIVEIGCGRGEFLEMWKSLPEETRAKHPGLEVQGIEHSTELVEEAVSRGLKVEQGFAEGDFRIPGGPFDAFVQFNFLEHQPDPRGMLRNIREQLPMGGLGLVTVPSFEYILAHDGYYELLRDHIANYTELTLQKLFQDCGFEVLESRIVNRDTLEMVVQKVEEDSLSRIMFQGKPCDVHALQENYIRLKQEIQEHLQALERTGRTMAIWGASHQGFTLASTTGLGGKVKYIIDSAPFKQNRFAPASHIPIVSPEHFLEDPVEEILIVAPGYTDEIAAVIRERYQPAPEILMLKAERIMPYSRTEE